MTDSRKILFVRSGGGMPGLDIHAGIWRALECAGIVATDVSGTSAGAIVSAYDSAAWSAIQFESYLRGHDDDSIRHPHAGWPLRIPWLESIHDNDRVYAVLDGSLPGDWTYLRKPFAAWATRLRDRERINVARPGIAATPALAALASMSIGGLFPAVTLADGESYVDGGLRYNLPFMEAEAADYDDVYLLIASPRAERYTRVDGILTNFIRDLQTLAYDQIADVLDETFSNGNVHVIWPDVGSGTGLLHFDHDLIDQAFFKTIAILDTLK